MLGSNPIAIRDHRALIYIGDVLYWLRQLADNSVDCVVTSPPYWGLRDYGTAFWVEGDPNCDHLVGATTRAPGNSRGAGNRGKLGHHEAAPTREIGGTCLRCGAIRTDYQMGLEPTLGQHLDVMIEVFAEVWRVLKPTGSLWLNYGDCYATAPNGRSAKAAKASGTDDRTFRDKPMSTIGPIYQPHHASHRGTFTGSEIGSSGYGPRRIDHGGRVVAGGVLKDKDLCMIPNRLAIALQEWGWWVRSEIIWGKLNPMPDSSGRQRPSTSHEKIFLLTKSGDADVWVARDTGELSFAPDLSERAPLVTNPDETSHRWSRIGAYYDAVSVMQPSSKTSLARMAQDIHGQNGSDRAHGGARRNGPMKAVSSKIAPAGERQRALTPRHKGQINHTGMDTLGRGNGRLLRNFEANPPPGTAPLPVWPMASVAFKGQHFATFPPELAERAILAGSPAGGLVLDPFGGAGTTALVALRHGRRAAMIELSPEYAEISRQRIEIDAMGEDEARYYRARLAAAEGAPLPLLDGEPGR